MTISPLQPDQKEKADGSCEETNYGGGDVVLGWRQKTKMVSSLNNESRVSDKQSLALCKATAWRDSKVKRSSYSNSREICGQC